MSTGYPVIFNSLTAFEKKLLIVTSLPSGRICPFSTGTIFLFSFCLSEKKA